MLGRIFSEVRFLGQFLTLNDMMLKFSQNPNFSYLLGIKSEIHYSLETLKVKTHVSRLSTG